MLELCDPFHWYIYVVSFSMWMHFGGEFVLFFQRGFVDEYFSLI